MLSSYFPLRKTKKLLQRCSLPVSGYNTILYSWLLMLFTGLQLYASGQANQANRPRVDNVPRSDTNNLGLIQRAQSRQYRASVNQKLTNNQLPYYPYVTINLGRAYLPPAPLRFYLGKLDTSNRDNFILIAMRCTKNNRPTNRGEIINYIDDSIDRQTGRPLPRQHSNWDVILVTKGSGNTDKVTYTRYSTRVVQQYVANFHKFMASRGLQKRYPVCFVLESSKLRQGRIKLQPVVARSGSSGSGSSGQQSAHRFRIFKFQDGVTYEFQDPDGNGQTCCQSPPEGGNSVEQNN